MDYYTDQGGAPVASIHWKLMFKASSLEAALSVERHLQRRMDADRLELREFDDGEEAVLQLIEDSISHLVGIDKDFSEQEQVDIFRAHYFAMQGRHASESMGDLWKLLQQLPDPEPMTCDECGEKLYQTVDPSQPRKGCGPERVEPSEDTQWWRFYWLGELTNGDMVA